MDRVAGVGGGQLSTRDLGTFNRWLCWTRVRAALAVGSFALLMRWLHPDVFALPPVLAICAGLLAVSAHGLSSRRLTDTMAFFVWQTFVDLAATTIGLAVATTGIGALLMRPLYAVVIVPAALISVPIGLVVATAATAAHVGLLVLEHGATSATFGSLECLAPPFLFFLVAQQAFFYGGHLERKNTALAALADEVRAASALKTEFVGAVSHELRSPLNVILGYLEMALDGELGPLTHDLQTGLRRTRDQSLALLEMITALLDLNRFESGRVPLECAPVAMRDLLEELTEQIPDAWHRPGVRLVMTPPDDDVPVVVTDRGKLKTVMRNLVHNALKFTTDGEVVVKATRTPQGELALSVDDTGCGIPDDALAYVFDRFRQVPGSGGGGVGLGLHIVKRLVDAVGGRLDVTSRVGVGTRFTVTIPATVAQAPTPVRRAA